MLTQTPMKNPGQLRRLSLPRCALGVLLLLLVLLVLAEPAAAHVLNTDLSKLSRT